MKIQIEVELDTQAVERMYKRCRSDQRYHGSTDLYRDLRGLIQGRVEANEFDFDMSQTDEVAAQAVVREMATAAGKE